MACPFWSTAAAPWNSAAALSAPVNAAPAIAAFTGFGGWFPSLRVLAGAAGRCRQILAADPDDDDRDDQREQRDQGGNFEGAGEPGRQRVIGDRCGSLLAACSG